MRCMMRLGLAVLTCVLAAVPAAAEPNAETLLASIPKGFKLGFQNRAGNASISEYVPAAETVENWTRMTTVQIFYGAPRATPGDFERTMSEQLKRACPGYEVAHVRDGRENGYPFAMWLGKCALNAKTGKPETTLFKAVGGTDSFYVVQKAFRFEPSRQDILDASSALRGVQVCDSRKPDHPCPPGIAPGGSRTLLDHGRPGRLAA